MSKARLQLESTPYQMRDNQWMRTAQAFAGENIADHAEDWEASAKYPLDKIQLASDSFGGFLIPKELGGVGGSVTEFVIMVEQLAKVDIAFALAFVVHNNAAFIISQSPNQKLKARLLPSLISAERISTFCLTEPQAGSDAAAISTRAMRVNGGFSINGKKAWVTAGKNAQDLVVFAKTSDSKSPKDIACFAVNAETNGVSFDPPYDLISGHLAGVCDLNLNNVRVEADDVLFGAGAAFGAAMSCLDAARLGIAAMCNGALTGALEVALEYCSQRQMFGAKTLDQQGIQWAFAERLTALEASRSLMFQTANLADCGQSITHASAHAKKFANHCAQDGLSWSMRAMGGIGASRKFGLARQFGAAQLLFNTDGTPEVMNVVLGRKLREFEAEN